MPDASDPTVLVPPAAALAGLAAVMVAALRSTAERDAANSTLLDRVQRVRRLIVDALRAADDAMVDAAPGRADVPSTATTRDT